MPSIVFYIKMTLHYVTKLTLSTKISIDRSIINSPGSSDGRALDCKGGGPGFESRSRQLSFFFNWRQNF